MYTLALKQVNIIIPKIFLLIVEKAPVFIDAAGGGDNPPLLQPSPDTSDHELVCYQRTHHVFAPFKSSSLSS